MRKTIIYQMLPRYWGNLNTSNIKGGTLEQNGCGRFCDVDNATLEYLNWMGCTHVWYTGIIRHAMPTDTTPAYDGRQASEFVKGNAGSPYAISNYYEPAPYLGDMDDFRALMARTHSAALKAIIDFIPNHIAPNYQDNFGGIPHCGHCDYDWTDTVKIDYWADRDSTGLPLAWGKLRDIVLHWAAAGVDGFRCDMVELVPPEFFKWLIENVKREYPNVIFIAEIYNKDNYRKYLREVGFDLLYDKSGLYDTLHALVCQQTSHCENDPAAWTASARNISKNWQSLGEMEGNMLNFLENHDEKRLASTAFAWGARSALAALGVSLMFNDGAFMLYAGQELGERGQEDAGQSGPDGRSTIYDWWSVDSLRTLNAIVHTKSYKSLSVNEIVSSVSEIPNSSASVRDAELFCRYAQALRMVAGFDPLNADSPAADSDTRCYDLCYCQGREFDPDTMFAFLRGNRLVVCNFSGAKKHLHVEIPADAGRYYGRNFPSEVFITVPAYDFSTREL